MIENEKIHDLYLYYLKMRGEHPPKRNPYPCEGEGDGKQTIEAPLRDKWLEFCCKKGRDKDPSDLDDYYRKLDDKKWNEKMIKKYIDRYRGGMS